MNDNDYLNWKEKNKDFLSKFIKEYIIQNVKIYRAYLDDDVKGPVIIQIEDKIITLENV